MLLASLGLRGQGDLRHEQVARVINALSGNWGWSRVDVARALLRAAPREAPKPRRKRKADELEDDGADGVDWQDLIELEAILGEGDSDIEEDEPLAPLPGADGPWNHHRRSSVDVTGGTG